MAALAQPAPELRFAFGANWRRFLDTLTDARIRTAEQSLRDMLGTDTLRGCTFIDVGSGSGLFSLAARNLGARVRSFDYDADSVGCTAALRRRFYGDDPDWRVEQGSALDRAYLASLGAYDVVYSWGVLHHTGAMWDALDNMIPLVKPGGLLFIAIYNDQGRTSRLWRRLKRTYNRLPPPLRFPYLALVMGPRETKAVAGAALRGRLGEYLIQWRASGAGRARGMSRWHDLVDWIGGYPFEVATPEAVFRFYRDRGFQLAEMTTCAGGIGCNQFVFRRSHQSVP